MLVLRLPCEQTMDSLCHLLFLPFGSVALGESQLPCLKNSYRALCRSPCGKDPRRPNRAREKWGPLTAVLGLNSLASWVSCPAKPSDNTAPAKNLTATLLDILSERHPAKLLSDSWPSESILPVAILPVALILFPLLTYRFWCRRNLSSNPDSALTRWSLLPPL